MTQTCLVHIVDDDEAMRDSLAFTLDVFGFDTRTYVDADDFLAHARTERSILISAVRMPGMSGFDLALLLRQEGSQMPIILMSGHFDSDFQTKAVRAGAGLALQKPIAIVELVAEIERMTPSL